MCVCVLDVMEFCTRTSGDTEVALAEGEGELSPGLPRPPALWSLGLGRPSGQTATHIPSPH